MDTTMLVTAFATLFVVIDPIGLTPLFVALTQGEDSAHRRSVALRASTIGFVVLLLFALFGEAVLGFIGISMSAFRIAGGILLLLTALDMLFERRTKRREDKVVDLPDPSVFPLATPLIAGPGAIASIILLMGQADGVLGSITVIGVMAVVVALVFVLFIAGGLLEKAIGQTGINVVTRLLGMLLAALSIQFIIDGLLTVSWPV
ncbi:MAG: MarC family protein [Paracoccaceae bacterium]|nr:MarC family protein [Paracoccaceae bacterium]MDG1736668.1 MarC family protein [Paracoccaceae bacterium]MDG2259250.1 MarC family protein [Paracoccaceae bacterium]